MAMELNKMSESRLSSVQELKLSKPLLNFQAGQILKAVVIAVVSDNEVAININGQNINAKTAHKFAPGELLQVKVVANQEETVLAVQKATDPHLLQSALRAALPKQAPATGLLFVLNQLQQNPTLPALLRQQISHLLGSIPSMTQLANFMPQAINQSGLFLEASLAEWRRGLNPARIKADFKGQCFVLLQQLPASSPNSQSYVNTPNSALVEHDPLPLPGAIPQPLHHGVINLDELSLASIQQLVREQIGQVLARITAQQITHLTQEPQQAYVLMLDLPVTINKRFEVIPLMIKHHKAEPMRASQWSVSFAVNLAELGGLQGSVSLNGQSLEVSLNTETMSTMNLFTEHQHELSQLFDDAGLQLKHFNVTLGLADNHIDAANLNLLDIRV